VTDAPVKLSRFRADVSRALARRGKTLLESNQLRQEVEALEPLEAYFIVKELGIEEAMPILHAATGLQLQTFVDLDCWNGDRPDPVELDAWLAAFSEQGPASLAEAFNALVEDLQVLFIAASVEIHDARDEDNVPEAKPNVPRKYTPDTYFVLDAIDAENREINVFTLIETLYGMDLDGTFALLMAAKWEQVNELEEQALHFRSGRLQDLGFPPLIEAQAIFAVPPSVPPANQRKIDPIPTSLPALYAEPFKRSSLFTRALGRISDEAALTAIESDIVYLVNAALVAYGESPRDIVHVAEIAERVCGTLSLGLETLLSAAKPLEYPGGEQAAQDAALLLHDWALRDIFRHGHQTALPLRAESVALTQISAVTQWLAEPDTEKDDYSRDRLDKELLRALLLRTPMNAGFDPLAPKRRRAIASSEDIAEIEARLRSLKNRFLGEN